MTERNRWFYNVAYNVTFCNNSFVTSSALSKQKINPVKHVRQLEDSGCGIACAAMILGLSYQETLNLFIEDDASFLSRIPSSGNRGAWNGPNHSTSLERIERILKRNGFRSKKTLKINGQTKNPILFKFAWNPRNYLYSTYHCSIVCDGKIYCPSEGVRDFAPYDTYIQNFNAGVDEPALLISGR